LADLTEKQIERRYAEGRGQGELSSYRPFIDHHDLSSLGRASRAPSRKTGRTHHFFSDVETSAFLELIRMPEVVDVREQFPLDREDTRAIAAEMGVDHPKYRNGVDTVMTTDLLVLVSAGSETIRYARAGKRVADLSDARTLEKLEIERRYWQRRGVHWSLVTELDRSDACVVALSWMHGMEELPENGHPAYWTDRIAAFRAEFAKARDMSLEDLDRKLVKHGFQAGEMLNVLRHLAWHGQLSFDLDQEFNFRWPTSRFVLTSSARRSAA